MSKQNSRLYEFGPYRLVPHEHLLLRAGKPVALTPKAFETLVMLVERCGRLVEKNELLNEVWSGTNVEESNIAQNVFALRRVLGRDEEDAQYIVTVPKRGYRFSANVKVIDVRGDESLLTQHAIDDGRSLESNGAGRRLDTPRQTPMVAPALTNSAEGPSLVSRRALKVGLLIVSVTLAAALVGLVLVIPRLFVSPATPSPPNSMKMNALLSGRKIWSAAVSPDGRHVAHVVENADQTSIWMRQISTTTDVLIVPSDQQSAYWGLTFSPDGDYLYYAKHPKGESFASLYRVPTLGGASRKIVSDIFSPITTSPDGQQIAFIRGLPGRSVLMIANADGTNERQLAVRQTPGEAFSSSPRGGPSWSPDGQTIATGIISLKGGYHGEVIAVSVSDGTERPLTSRRWLQVAQVGWLADGNGLLAAAKDSSNAQIWHISYPDGAVRKITNNLNDYHGVSLTADSRKLVTVQYYRPSTIAFVPEKQQSESPRTTAGMNEGFYGMSWTPDGKLVYACEASGNLDIWRLEQDGVTARQLTTDPDHDSTPSVSPDGRSIVFISHRNGGLPHVWRMDIDGGNLKQLTRQVGEGSPSFTPDGSWVVYAVFAAGIWKVPSEGGEPVLILRGASHSPSLSPDGAFVACDYWDEKVRTSKMALLPIEGGAPIRVFDEPEGISSATIRWTANGRALIYVRTREGVSNLWTFPLDGASPRPLTDFTSDLIFNFAWSRDNKQLALARGSTVEHVVLVSDFR